MGTLLIVDDERTNLEIYNQLLAGLSYTILFAPNGKVAISIAKKRLPDMIIMDWQMPIMDGLEAMKAIKGDPETKNIPIVIATGVMLSAENLLEAFNEGAHGYIPKPFRKLDLMAVINATLSFSKSQQDIQQKNEELERLNNQKEHVLNIVAHDLKSPLNKLKSFIQLTQMSGSLNDEQGKYLQLMFKIINEGEALIQDLLDLHAYEHKSSAVEFRILDAYGFVENCIKEYQRQAADKQITLQLNAADKGLMCYTDALLLGRILDNLLSNAIKFSFSGKNITISVRLKGAFVQFCVKDEGPGISEEEQKMLFNKFQRLSPQPTGGESSTGLGLSIVKTLVEELNGSIEVHSKPLIGSEFIVNIPSASVRT